METKEREACEAHANKTHLCGSTMQKKGRKCDSLKGRKQLLTGLTAVFF